MSGITTAPRLYVASALALGVEPMLSQGHYLSTVLRKSQGDVLRLFNGRDGEWQAVLISVTKRACIAKLEKQLRPQAEETGPSLFFPLLKKQRLDFLIEKAVELGVETLIPIKTARGLTDKLKSERLQAQIIEAAEQCERLTIPTLSPLTTLQDALAKWPQTKQLFTALEREEAPTLPAKADAGLIIGPEGGFTDHERTLLSDHEKVTPVSLGPRILRAETAALAGLARLTS